MRAALGKVGRGGGGVPPTDLLRRTRIQANPSKLTRAKHWSIMNTPHVPEARWRISCHEMLELRLTLVKIKAHDTREIPPELLPAHVGNQFADSFVELVAKDGAVPDTVRILRSIQVGKASKVQRRVAAATMLSVQWFHLDPTPKQPKQERATVPLHQILGEIRDLGHDLQTMPSRTNQKRKCVSCSLSFLQVRKQMVKVVEPLVSHQRQGYSGPHSTTRMP